MQSSKKVFKKPPTKYKPRGLEILHEDLDIIVVNKSNGLLTIASNKEKEKTVFNLLNDYVKKGNMKSRNRVIAVHRLEREMSGILVFAKSEAAKNFLIENWSNFDRKYIAITHGIFEKPEGTISSYLKENSIFRVYSVQKSEEGTLSKTTYKVLKSSSKFSLVEIKLRTNHKKQIRVHCADIGHPIVGDKIYGDKSDKGSTRLALHANSLSILHPFSKEKMKFVTPIPLFFKTLLSK